ncbi:MAG: hypothetical protein Q8Q33_08875 [Chlamydiota bacterium]|nr:hypothetical protein [Chlamydiota bacterium]
MMSHNQYTLDLTACEYYRASEIILVHGQSDGCDQRQHKTQIGRFSSIQCEETGNTVYTMTIANITSGGSVDCAPEEDNVIFTFSFDPSPPSHCTLTPDSELCNG